MDPTTVTICAEQTPFQDTALELVNYLALSFSTEEEQVAFAEGFFKGVEDDKVVFDRILSEVKGFGAGSEAQVEGFFNLLLSTIFSLYPPSNTQESSERLLKLVSIVSSIPSTTESTKTTQYRILSTIHNILPPTSPLRPSVFISLLTLASTNGDVSALGLTPESIEASVAGWRKGGVSEGEVGKALEAVVTSFRGTPSEFTFSLLTLSLTQPTPEQIISTTASAVARKNLIDLKPLLTIPSVADHKAKNPTHAVWKAVDVFTSGGLNDIKNLPQSELESAGVDIAAFTHKVKLLTLTSLCASTTSTPSREVSYAQVAKTLDVPVEEVENWVIEAISVGLLTAKLSQPTKTLRVQTAYIRSFGKNEWTALRARLLEWQTNLGSVLSVLQEAGGIEAAINDSNGSSSVEASA